MGIIIVFIIILLFIGFLLAAIEGQKPKIRRPAFKKLYELDQVQPIIEFEDKMIKGMFAENREVFVTAFVNDTHVLRVTATMGSKYHCRNSDNISLWGDKAHKIGATKIMQYHNHPDVFGRSFPSNTDKNSHRVVKPFLSKWNIEYQSLLIYKSWFGRAVIKEYH
jgi:DNA repair protein RadC